MWSGERRGGQHRADRRFMRIGHRLCRQGRRAIGVDLEVLRFAGAVLRIGQPQSNRRAGGGDTTMTINDTDPSVIYSTVGAREPDRRGTSRIPLIQLQKTT